MCGLVFNRVIGGKQRNWWETESAVYKVVSWEKRYFYNRDIRKVEKKMGEVYCLEGRIHREGLKFTTIFRLVHWLIHIVN